MSTITVQNKIELLSCCNCGGYIALESAEYESRLEDGQSFWCPRGHSQSFTRRKTMQEKLDAANARAARLEREAAAAQKRAELEAAAASKAKEALAKERKRTKSGTCPCCNRNFVALARHIKNKHPEFA